MLRKSFRASRIWTVVALTVLAVVSSVPASLAGQGPPSGCPWCVSPTTCSRVEENAADECRIVGSGYCENGTGICVWGGDELAMRLGIEKSALRKAQTEYGALVLIPVASGRFAAWTCTGRLLYLEEQRGSSFSRLPTAAYSEAYQFDRIAPIMRTRTRITSRATS